MDWNHMRKGHAATVPTDYCELHGSALPMATIIVTAKQCPLRVCSIHSLLAIVFQPDRLCLCSLFRFSTASSRSMNPRGSTNVPETFPHILKTYAKGKDGIVGRNSRITITTLRSLHSSQNCIDALRTQPYDLLSWSAAYFRCIADNLDPPTKHRFEESSPSHVQALTVEYLKVLVKQVRASTCSMSTFLLHNEICSARSLDGQRVFRREAHRAQPLEELEFAGGRASTLLDNWRHVPLEASALAQAGVSAGHHSLWGARVTIRHAQCPRFGAERSLILRFFAGPEIVVDADLRTIDRKCARWVGVDSVLDVSRVLRVFGAVGRWNGTCSD